MDQDRKVEAFFGDALELTRKAVEAQVEQYAPTMFDFHPLPWREDALGLQGLDAEGKSVFIVAGLESGRCRELRAEIVHRVNVYQDLVDALKLALPLAEQWADGDSRSSPVHDDIAQIKAALAKCEGRS